jgi:hypothetical protein
VNSGVLRGALIAYGIAAFTYFYGKALPSGWVLMMLGAGVALQLILFGLRKLALPAQAMQLAGLVADGITVLLFALGTFRGMAGQVEAL